MEMPRINPIHWFSAGAVGTLYPRDPVGTATWSWPGKRTRFGNITLKIKNQPSKTSKDSSPAQNSLLRFGKLCSLTNMSTSAKSMQSGLGIWQMRRLYIGPGSSSLLSTKSRQKTLLCPKDLGCQHMNVMQMQSNLPTHTGSKNWQITGNTCSNSSTQSALQNKGMSFNSIRHSEPHSPMMSDAPLMMSTHATPCSSPWLGEWELTYDQ